MNTPHTPGQHNEPHGGNWTVADYSEEQCEIVSEGTVHVAFCNESPKGRANARLIAAAPELLATLEDAHALLHGPVSDVLTGDQLAESGAYRVMEAMRNAIAKARTP